MLSPKAILHERGLHPKRSFGQNFLGDRDLLARLAALCGQEPADVIEIGAGLGHFTRALLERGHRVIAIERDRDLVPVLHSELADFVQAGALRLVEADAKQVDYEALFASFDREQPITEQTPRVSPLPEGSMPSATTRARVVVGNLPYQLTGPLLRRVAELGPGLARALLLVQLEVAQRLTSSPSSKTYGALTVFTQAVFTIRRELVIKSGAFYPQPQVDSAAVMLTPRALLEGTESPSFALIVHAAFQQRRKRLGNALASLAWVNVHGKAALTQVAERAGVDLDARGETLSVERFAALTQCLDSH